MWFRVRDKRVDLSLPEQDAQLSQRDCAAGCVSFCQKWKTGTASLLFNFWTLCMFVPPSRGLGTTYDVHLGLIRKHLVDFLLLLIELFLPVVTAEALRAKIDRKLVISLQCGQFDPKSHVEGSPPPVIFAQIVRPINPLQLCRWYYSHKETL